MFSLVYRPQSSQSFLSRSGCRFIRIRIHTYTCIRANFKVLPRTANKFPKRNYWPLSSNDIVGTLRLIKSSCLNLENRLLICIDKTNIFLTSPVICIVLTIRSSMSKVIHIAVHNIATLCASIMHITPIKMIVFNTFKMYCHIRYIA